MRGSCPLWQTGANFIDSVRHSKVQLGLWGALIWPAQHRAVCFNLWGQAYPGGVTKPVTSADAVLVSAIPLFPIAVLAPHWWYRWVWGHGWGHLCYSLKASLCISIGPSRALVWFEPKLMEPLEETRAWAGWRSLRSWLILPVNLRQNAALFAEQMGQIPLWSWLSHP